jgi:hypothetical protein
MKTSLLIALIFITQVHSVSATSYHQSQTDDDGYPLQEAAGSLVGELILSGIENNQRRKELNLILSQWAAQTNTSKSVEVEVIRHSFFADAPIDTSGQMLIQLSENQAMPIYLAMVVEDGWCANGQLELNRVNSFPLDQTTMEAFMLGYLSAISGVRIYNLNELPVYEKVARNSRKYIKYIEQIRAGNNPLPRNDWPESLPLTDRRVNVYRRCIALKDLDGISRDGYFGKTFSNGTYKEFEVDFNYRKTHVVTRFKANAYDAYATGRNAAIGSQEIGFFYLDNYTIWYLTQKLILKN